MRISDWSSDVCSSDLPPVLIDSRVDTCTCEGSKFAWCTLAARAISTLNGNANKARMASRCQPASAGCWAESEATTDMASFSRQWLRQVWRSEEHTSELQSLMRNSYAVFCLKKHKQESTLHMTS